MNSVEVELRARLREAGLTARVVEAAWPAWWSDDAAQSASAVAELHFSLARQLGMSPTSLMSDRQPQFLWHDETKYKNLGTTSDLEATVLASFSVAVSRVAITATAGPTTTVELDASALRASLLRRFEFIGLRELLTLCWGVGIPVLQLKLFPLASKRMHAVSARLGERHAILVGRESRFPSQVAFWVAHELGHIARGDVADAAALMDVDDPLQTADRDVEESGADAWALELLTGDPERVVEADRSSYRATDVATAVVKAGKARAIDPGILALCLGHNEASWAAVMGALKILGEFDVGRDLNLLAANQLDWDGLTLESRDFLQRVLEVDQ